MVLLVRSIISLASDFGLPANFEDWNSHRRHSRAHLWGPIMKHHISIHSLEYTLQWHHNKLDGISNHWPPNCFLNCLFRCWSKKTLKLRVTGLCEGNSLVTSEFPAQRASNTENVSIWWRHHASCTCQCHIIYIYIYISLHCYRLCCKEVWLYW